MTADKMSFRKNGDGTFTRMKNGEAMRETTKPDKEYKVCPICELPIEKKNYNWHTTQHSKDSLKYLNQKLQGGQDDTN